MKLIKSILKKPTADRTRNTLVLEKPRMPKINSTIQKCRVLSFTWMIRRLSKLRVSLPIIIVEHLTNSL